MAATPTRPHLLRLALLLYLRGFVVLALAAIALRWPEATLLSSMLVAGGAIGALGVFELALALVAPPQAARRYELMHAAMPIAFGLAAVTAVLTSYETTSRVCATWLVVHAAVVLAFAGGLSVNRRQRRALIAWSAANALAALLVAARPADSPVRLLYLGAGYALVYAIVQIAAALQLRRCAFAASAAPGNDSPVSALSRTYL